MELRPSSSISQLNVAFCLSFFGISFTFVQCASVPPSLSLRDYIETQPHSFKQLYQNTETETLFQSFSCITPEEKKAKNHFLESKQKAQSLFKQEGPPKLLMLREEFLEELHKKGSLPIQSFYQGQKGAPRWLFP